MMHFFQVVAVFVSLLLLHAKPTVGIHAGTKFIIEPEKVYGSLGSDATFHWKFTFGDEYDWKIFDDIFWGKTDNNEQIKNKYVSVLKDKSLEKNPELSNAFKSRVGVTTANVSQHGCNVVFVLRNVTSSDVQETYGCTARFPGDKIRSGPVRLVVPVPPKIVKKSNATIDTEDGDKVNLQCNATGDPTPSIKWTKDGTPVSSSSTVLITNIELKDAGSYVCTAANLKGSVSYRAQVRVLRYRPHINMTASSNALKKSWLNHVTSLKCAVYANPAANFTWFKDGRPVLDGFNSTRDVSTLTLTPTSASDFGSYSCKATNIKGHAWHNITLEQLFPPKIAKISNGSIDTEDGDKVNLQCNATGDPTPSIKWTKDGTLMSNSSTILITNIELKDAGSYVCTAANQAGSESYTVQVRVLRYRPHINTTASSNALKKSWLNHVTSLKCAVYANPAANFTWFKDGRPVLDGFNSTRDVSTLTLTPTSASDFGSYSCKATNIKGHAWHNITLEQLYPPARILYMTAVASLLAVNVSWNSTNNQTGVMILDYKITVIDSTTLRKQEYTGINVSTLHVTSLKHNTTYIIKVQARNKVGYGEPTSRNVTTLEADPPGPPVVRVFPRVFSMKVIWNSSRQDINNIKILDYRIKLIDGSNYKQILEHTAVNGTSFVIENLKRNSTYTAELQARNEVGYGETVKISASTLLEGPPDAPVITNITVNGSRCMLQWTKPYNGEYPIQIYTVSVWVLLATNGSDYKKRLNAWNTTETNYTLEVEWNQNYTTAVSAWNKYGQSYLSSERNFKTERFPQDLSTTSTTPLVTEELSTTLVTSEVLSTTLPVTKVKTAESVAKEGKINKHSFSYLAPLWIVVLAFAVPAALFMLWKATQKIIFGHCCKRRPRPRRRQLHNRDSESSATVMEEVKERTEENHYETITEIVETHFNHGYSTDDVKSFGNDLYHMKQSVIPGYDAVYNHLYETKTGTRKVDTSALQSGLGLFLNQGYSHLIHGDSFAHTGPPKMENRSGLERSKSQSWEISRDRLKIKTTIGRGEFGLVKKGLALNVSQSGGWIPVAVKTLNEKDGANDLCRRDLLSELKVMKDLSPHKHVIQLLACITKSDPLCVITEFAPYGDLLGFLRKKRGLRDGYYNTDQLPKQSLTSQQLMQFAWEIADGMAYLSSEKIVHRDLAARNVLLDENLTCKVTDFGMARDIRDQDMYQKTTGGRLPVKWTAMEALLHGRYTTKSDVWSFGVVLFEIVTIGGCPYPDMEVLELISKLENGYRMEKPRHLSKEVYSVMLSCWNADPEKRPTFTRLHSALNQLSNEKQACINLKAYDGRIYENLQKPFK